MNRLTALPALVALAVPGSAHANAACDRKERLRYAKETVNLTYSKFMSREADFADKGCNAQVRSNAFARQRSGRCQRSPARWVRP